MERRKSPRKRFKCPRAIRMKMPRFKPSWRKVQRLGSRCRKTCRRRFINPSLFHKSCLALTSHLFFSLFSSSVAIEPQQQELHEQTSLLGQQLPVLVKSMTLALDPKKNRRSAISVIAVAKKGTGFKIVPKTMTLQPPSASVSSESPVFPGVSSRL